VVVLGLHGKVLVAQGYRGGFCEKMPEASPVSIEPMPASSRMDPPLAKAKPTSDSGSASGITQLRRGSKTCATAAAVRERSGTM